jgi:hypothetical protein
VTGKRSLSRATAKSGVAALPLSIVMLLRGWTDRSALQRLLDVKAKYCVRLLPRMSLQWHIASIRGNAALRPLSERSGHRTLGMTLLPPLAGLVLMLAVALWQSGQRKPWPAKQ